MTGKTIPVFAWNAASAAPALHFSGPEKFGGFGDVTTKARTQAEATGRNVEDLIDEVGSIRSYQPKVTDCFPLVVSILKRRRDHSPRHASDV